MALTTGPNLGLLVNGDLGEDHYTLFMRFLRGVDGLVQPRVLDKDLTTPPGSPTNGAMYIVAAGATGAWSGQAQKLARWSSVASAWEFYTASSGWIVFVVDETLYYRYTGSAWTTVAASMSAIPTTEKGAANGVATLDAGGKVPAAQLPLIALTDVSVVASQAAQLALTAEEGDVAIRSDQNKSYVHNGGTSGTMTDWSELLTPTDTVLSVFGRTGAVVATAGDYNATQVTFTPAGGIAAITVQAAIEELDTETVKLAGTQTVAGDKTFSGVTTVSNATAASSSTTGALVVTGGVGIGGVLYVGGGGSYINQNISISGTGGATDYDTGYMSIRRDNGAGSRGASLNFIRYRGSGAVITSGDDIAKISGSAYVGSTGGEVRCAEIVFDTEGTLADTTTGIGGVVKVRTAAVGGSLTTRMTITSGGAVLIGGDTAGVSSENLLASNTGTTRVGTIWSKGTSGDNVFFSLGTEGSYTERGSITYNRGGGLVAYNTTSDYRLKDLHGPVGNALNAVLALKTYMGRMKEATMDMPMFVAHEVEEVAPYAVTGTKDAVDEQCRIIPQQLDPSKLIPLLVAAVQELALEVQPLR